MGEDAEHQIGKRIGSEHGSATPICHYLTILFHMKVVADDQCHQRSATESEIQVDELNS